MTGSDDGGQGDQPAARAGTPAAEDNPASGRPEDRPFSPGQADDRRIPGPRPGMYPPPGKPRPAAGHGSATPADGRPDAGSARDPSRTRAPVRQSGSRRRPGPALAQRQLMERISAGRKARLQRAMLGVVGAFSAVVMMTAGGAWVLTTYVSSSLGRVNAGIAGTPASGPLNILVAGVDVRAGLTPHQQAALHVGHVASANSDTLMLAHIPADHQSVSVVSLPRDSWVDIPGHGFNKINAAYGLGGPQLMVATIEHATGLQINDYIEVNFLGFVRVIDALGGVNVCLPYPVADAYTGLHMAAGRHHVSGITALKFARDRHSFALSDLARIGNQQQLLSSLLTEAVTSGTLANPVRLGRFLAAASAAVKVDEGFNISGLANQMRGVRPSDVSFTTVPVQSANYLTPTGQSAVLWSKTGARALFAALGTDHAPPPRKRPRSALRRGQVSVDVYNGTLIGGLSASTATQLAALGYRIHGSALTWPTQDVRQTLIEYPAADRAAAGLLRTALPGATLRQVSRLARVRIVLGASGYTVAAPQPRASRTVTPAKTAAQNACR